jgi:hypothetical protein
MKQIFCFLMFVLVSVCLSAQTMNVPIVNPKFGKPTKEEMLMSVYEPDSTAAVVCLYKETKVTYFDIQSMLYQHKIRLKILKESGLSHALVSIYSRGEIEKLTATAYNMVNGEVESTIMGANEVSAKRIDHSKVLTRFTVPQVKVGTIIEYEYEEKYYKTLKYDWIAQDSIPVRYAFYDVTVPEIYEYNIEILGFNRLISEKNKGTSTFTNGSYMKGSRYKFKGELLPAFKVEPFVWHADDYRTKVNFVLKRTGLPQLAEGSPSSLWSKYNFFVDQEIAAVTNDGKIQMTLQQLNQITDRAWISAKSSSDFYSRNTGYYRTRIDDFEASWEEVDKSFNEPGKYGDLLKMENPLKAEMNQLNLNSMGSDEEKICAIFQLLKSKVEWNEKYDLFGRAMDVVLKEGKGSNADINYILISMLKDANIAAIPVVMGLRDRASVSILYPSLDYFSTFVVGVVKDSTLSFIDGSLNYGYLDVLPPVLMSNRARVLMEGEDFWVNLQKAGNNSARNTFQATLSPEGKVEGTRTVDYYGQFAFEFKKKYHESKDSLAFIQRLEILNDVKFHSFIAKGLKDFSAKVTEKSSFTKEAKVCADSIYLNPLLFMHVDKPLFTQSGRKFPIEFDYPYDYHIRVSLTIPEGYSVVKIPQSVNLVTRDKQMSLLYQVEQQGQQIAIKYKLNLNELFYHANKYQDIRQFWERVAEINNSMLVLSKNK